MTGTSNLSDKQFRILEFLFDQISMVGRPPTIREICDHFGFASPRSASDHLKALEKKGYIHRTKSPRGIQLAYDKVWELFGIPILDHLDQDAMTVSEGQFSGTLTPSDLYPVERRLFAVRVPDDTMANAGIRRGDLLILREQATPPTDTVVLAIVDDTLAIRTLRKRKGGSVLEAVDPDSPAVPAVDARILGEAIRVVRDL